MESKIQLGDIRGRLDHMAVDLRRQRLFVVELENDNVGVIDFERREIAHVITEVKGPQGLAYMPGADTLFVANGGDGVLRMFDGARYRALESMHVGVPTTSASTPKAIIYLSAMENGHRLANWPTGNGSNFPLALNTASAHVFVVFRNPATLVAFAASSGTAITKVETCGDADDIFVDAKRRRVYVSCDDGFLDVFDANPYQLVERIPTIKGARTSLLVPEIDRLFVVARATAEAPAAVWVFRPGP